MSAAEVLEEFQVLIHGLWIGVRGPSEVVAALPQKGPEMRGRDLGVFLLFVLTQLMFNWGMRLLVIEPFLKYRQFKDKMRQKFSQAFMEFLFYGFYSVVGGIIVLKQPWIWPSDLWWRGFSWDCSSNGLEVMRADMRCYYLAYGARYLQAALSGFIEHKRKDFLEMQIHHWVTVTIILLSFSYGWVRVGAVVMWLLDPADTCLHIAKMFKYSSDSLAKGHPRKGFWQSCADVMFVIFALVWLPTRLGLYPYCCWSAHVETGYHFNKQIPEWSAVIGLEILLVLQMYWTYLLVKGIVKMLTKGGVEDVRSDSDVSDVGEEDTKKSK